MRLLYIYSSAIVALALAVLVAFGAQGRVFSTAGLTVLCVAMIAERHTRDRGP